MRHRTLRITPAGQRWLELNELRQRLLDLVNPSQVLLEHINKEIANANTASQERREQGPQQLTIPE